MEKTFTEWSLGELLRRIADPTPGPSAGTAAATSAALGVGLLILGVNVARQRWQSGKALPSEADGETGEALVAHCSALQQRLMQGAQDDQTAVRRLLLASRDAKAAALEHATQVPLALAQTVVEALGLAETVGRLAPPPVRADVAAGAILLEGALQALRAVLETNLRVLPAGAERDTLAQAYEALETGLPVP